MLTKTHVTLEDLYAVSGKAELVNGELVLMSPTGDKPGRAGDEIAEAEPAIPGWTMPVDDLFE